VLLNKLAKPIKFILSVYALGIVLFTTFRFVLFLLEIDQVQNIASIERTSIILQSFLMGFRFDTVISSYILLLPTLFLLITEGINWRSSILKKFIHLYLFLFYSISFLICGADISYFQHFFSRFNIAAFQWMDTPEFMVNMILEEFDYWWVIFPMLISWILFYFGLQKIVKRHLYSSKEISKSLKGHITYSVGSVLFLFIILLGIRGRIDEKSPIRVGTAYFSNYTFANQLGLNPVFTLLRSVLDNSKSKNKPINLLDNQIAIKNVQYFLDRESGNNISPIAKVIVPDSISENKPNVVLILMESMSANKMKRYGNNNNLTPFFR